ncbi:hypothetical protein AVEN_195561-1 [Araneus ventricosus]|uniref:Uncharacterized protein n=1 Tax=Araneus ventricosus TaxID=182803 RepID=A0A4Y2EUR1_ARAVE|nr:hypothetical protein AVEN_195561-1 [Araneus ventricosus]
MRCQALLKYEGTPFISRKGRLRVSNNLSLDENISMGERASNDGNIPKKRQGISSLPTGENTPKQARQVVPYPLQKIKLDMSSHLPQYMDDKFTSKYRYPGCKSRSRIKRTKYNVYLCILENNFFLEFHSN